MSQVTVLLPGREEIALTEATAPLDAQAIEHLGGKLASPKSRKPLYKVLSVPSHPILFSSSQQIRKTTAPHQPFQSPNIIIIRLQPSIHSANTQHSLPIIS